jgi:hypothetical protein
MKLTTHLHLVPRSIMHGTMPPLPQYAFIAWCLVKHRDNFAFTFYLSQVIMDGKLGGMGEDAVTALTAQ